MKNENATRWGEREPSASSPGDFLWSLAGEKREPFKNIEKSRARASISNYAPLVTNRVKSRSRFPSAGKPARGVRGGGTVEAV